MSDEIQTNSTNSTSENSNKSFFKKIGSAISTWLKSGLKWIIIGICALLAFVLGKKTIKYMLDSDANNKNKVKEDAKNTVDKINESISTANSVENNINDIKESIHQDKENIKINNNNYVNQQTETAQNAGFKKEIK